MEEKNNNLSYTFEKNTLEGWQQLVMNVFGVFDVRYRVSITQLQIKTKWTTPSVYNTTPASFLHDFNWNHQRINMIITRSQEISNYSSLCSDQIILSTPVVLHDTPITPPLFSNCDEEWWHKFGLFLRACRLFWRTYCFKLWFREGKHV